MLKRFKCNLVRLLFSVDGVELTKVPRRLLASLLFELVVLFNLRSLQMKISALLLRLALHHIFVIITVLNDNRQLTLQVLMSK